MCPPPVLKSYISSIKSMCSRFNIDSSYLNHFTVTRYLRSITINSPFSPTPRGIFDVKTLYQISIACDLLPDPILYRAIFLVAFFAFLRMSNIAPHSAKLFNQDKHILRQDVTFHPPGAHILIKWTKTLQDYRSHHMVQLPTIRNIYLCPVRALQALLTSRPLPLNAPLFANKFPPYAQVIDTHIRDALKIILCTKEFQLLGMGFIHSGGQGPPLTLIIMFHFKTLWPMGCGKARPSGHTSRMPPWPPLSSLPLSAPSSLLIFSWAWALKFSPWASNFKGFTFHTSILLTCIIKYAKYVFYYNLIMNALDYAGQ